MILGILLFGCIGFSVYAQELEWGSMNEVESSMKENPKKVLVYVTTNWCGWCKRMNANTFSKPEIMNYLNNNFHIIKLDGEEKETINFMDHTFNFKVAGRRGYNELAYSILEGRLSYPSLVFLDEQFNRITIAPGYRESSELMPLLEYVSEEFYKTQSLEEYQKGK